MFGSKCSGTEALHRLLRLQTAIHIKIRPLIRYHIPTSNHKHAHMATGLQGKVIVITGGASGIGLATAKLCAARGAKVSIADVHETQLASAKTDIESVGGTVLTSVVDVRNRAHVEAWIACTVDIWGKIHGAANIAGVTGKGIGVNDVKDVDDEDWDFVIDVNLKGVLNCMRPQIKNMVDKGGSIVNCASVAGEVGFPKNSAYTASKHAVIGLSRSAAAELGHRGLRVNVVAPYASNQSLMIVQ